MTRKGMRGIPGCVVQEEQKSRKKKLEVRGTTKEEIMKGKPKCPDLISTSFTDTTLIHYLRMSSGELKWVVCEKDVYNVETGAKEPLQFLRMCYINDYNHQIGDVDKSDQLRNNFRFDDWLRKRKWWWSIMFWSIGIILVNAYIVYRRENLKAGVSKSDLLLQHNLRK